MSNHMKFCSCQACKRGRHSKFGKTIVRQITRRFRRLTKQSLQKGEDPPKIISVPYTD